MFLFHHHNRTIRFFRHRMRKETEPMVSPIFQFICAKDQKSGFPRITFLKKHLFHIAV